jgi:hypothetical protein
MQLLGGPPRAVIAVSTQMLDDEPYVFQVANPHSGTPEAEALRELADERGGSLDERRGGRSRRRHFVELVGCGTPAYTLRLVGAEGEEFWLGGRSNRALLPIPQFLSISR